jgi:hypothetical protein
MQKFSEFVNEQKLQKVAKAKEDQAHKFNELYENKLKQFGVTSPIELNEEQSAEFFDYIKSISVVNGSSVNEGEVKNEADFKKYLLEHYTFLSRPVFIIDGKIYIGNSQKNILEVTKVLS